MYIVASNIRRLAKQQKKRVSRSYLGYLERKVFKIVSNHISLLGSRVTLNAEDAEALDAYRMTRT